MNISLNDLRKISVFQHATDADLELVLNNCIVRSVEEGEYFFLQGDEAKYLYVLVTGQVKLMQSNPNGQQVNLRTIYPWQMFGALGATRGEDAIYPAMAQTFECSTAIAIPSHFLRTMMETRSYLSFDLMNLMTTYIQELQTRYREIATNRVEQRIANALIRLAQQSGIRSGKDAGIELFFSRKDVSEMTGATVFSVSRLISEWERKNIIKAGRERIQILDPHALMQIAEGHKE